MSENAAAGAAAIATSAALAMAVGLPLLQLDALSRRILSSERLRAKRRKSQVHEMDKAVEVQRVRVRAAIQAKAAPGGGRDGSAWRYVPDEERAKTELLTAAEEFAGLIDLIMDDRRPAPHIAAIDRDEADGLDRTELYLWLAFPPPSGICEEDGGEDGGWIRVQVPLVPFATALADAFETRITSTTLAFVADATSGLAAEVLGPVFRCCGAGLALVTEPSWMVTTARIIEKDLVRPDRMARVIFGLCRLEAWRLRHRVGKCRTVVFILPGQSCTRMLLPVVQNAFPHDRHVFAYDSCAETVRRGVALRRSVTSSVLGVDLRNLVLPAFLGGAASCSSKEEPVDSAFESAARMPQWVTSSIPVTQLPRSMRKLPEAFSDMDGEQAGIIEAWLGSVDTFLQLKENERSNNYIPFTCRMGFIMGRTGLGNLAEDNLMELNELALVNLLQYVTGSRSRPLQPELIRASLEILTVSKADAEELVRDCVLSDDDMKRIEACCFLHHGILIQDKTLLDTVQPKKEWSLKATRKLTACACCDPGEDEEGEDGNTEEGDMEWVRRDDRAESGGRVDMSMPGTFDMGLSRRPGVGSVGGVSGSSSETAAAKKSKPRYVDGKMGFAFDPSKF